VILNNLLRRKGRTMLTVLGISIGVAAIITLGSLADGLQAGYNGMMSGSKADLVLSQSNSYDLSLSTVDYKISDVLLTMPEVKAISGMIQGMAQTEGVPYFFIFGYPDDSFVLSRFQITQGMAFNQREAQRLRGKPILLGSSASETLKKSPGDTIRIMGTVFRVVGIYQTGDAFEDSGAVMSLSNSQELMGKTHQVSLFYIQLKEPGLKPRFEARVKRLWPDLLLAGTKEFASSNGMVDMLRVMIWVISGLAILIGGVGMMNAQLMAVFERTREIGVLRAVGWSQSRVLLLILGESVMVCLAGGIFGLILGWQLLNVFSGVLGIFGASANQISPILMVQAFGVVLVLGLSGGLFPAWRASRFHPIEALRYEGGSGGGQLRRFPLGSMEVQSLWQRSTRTLLTVGAIALTVGSILSIDALMQGLVKEFTQVFSSDAEVILRQKEVSDTSQSALDERIGDKIGAFSDVQAVSGMVLTAVMMPESSNFFIVQGYDPASYAMRRFNIVEGKTLTGNRQVMLGRRMAESLHRKVGDSIVIGGSRFRIQGLFESGVGWEEMGGIISLRDAQTLVGRPRKVTLYMVKMQDPNRAPALVQRINGEWKDTYAALTGEFVDQMPDMKTTYAMMDGISFMAILVGSLGVMNTMLMAVLERTREIGVLRAVGWRRQRVLSMIVKESLLLGTLGGAMGVLVGIGFTGLLLADPIAGGMLKPIWSWQVLARGMGIALLLGLVGGLYPAYRATRLEPVEALRYE
jgi:ABC-type antimicrobial peptide transport system permease subunit